MKRQAHKKAKVKQIMAVIDGNLWGHGFNCHLAI